MLDACSTEAGNLQSVLSEVLSSNRRLVDLDLVFHLLIVEAFTTEVSPTHPTLMADWFTGTPSVPTSVVTPNNCAPELT